MGYKALRLSLSLVCLSASMMAARAGAEEGLIAGITAGVAAPVDRFESRAKPGGAVSPFVGYMFLPYIGVVGEAQFVAFPARFNANRDTADIWALGGLAGPRLALPLRLGDVDVELNGTWEGGVFTGLNGDTPISRTSWGYSTGGGFDVRLSDDFLLGLFARYNWLDQRSEPGEDVQYVTGGLALTYNAAPPPPRPEPAPPVVEPMAEAAPPPIAHAKKIVLRGVQFDFGSARIRADARPVLDEAAATLVREGEINIIAEGHTDDVGSEANNLRLSQQRAKAVRDYLVTAGVAGSRIRVEGYGESRPVASNTTDEGRAQNRRVELRIE